MQFHGEYKVPGGKLVVVDLTATDEGVFTAASIAGDFFLEPDSALESMNASLVGLGVGHTIAQLQDAVQASLPAEASLLGFSAQSVAVAVRRAVTGAAGWRDFDWTVIRGEVVSPAVNAALDEVLTESVGSGSRGATLRFWEWDRPAVFIGSFQSLRNEVDVVAAKARDVQIVRRISGGGAMYMQPEACITFALYAPGELVRGLSFEDSYAFLDEWVLEALNGLGIAAYYMPLNDIASAAGKIGGAAQKRLRSGAVLHHVTLAYDIDREAMTEVLRIGREKLSDKGTKSAAKRVDPLRSQTGLSREAIVDRLVDVFSKRHGACLGEVSVSEWQAAEKLAAVKFTDPGWTARVP